MPILPKGWEKVSKFSSAQHATTKQLTSTKQKCSTCCERAGRSRSTRFLTAIARDRHNSTPFPFHPRFGWLLRSMLATFFSDRCRSRIQLLLFFLTDLAHRWHCIPWRYYTYIHFPSRRFGRNHVRLTQPNALAPPANITRGGFFAVDTTTFRALNLHRNRFSPKYLPIA